MNTLRNELHLHVKKSGKPSNPYPTSRCRNCTRQGKPGVTTRYVCDSCPQTPGLCSKACFISFHQGFETLLAARKIHTETAPENPPEPEPEPAAEAVSQPSTVIEAVSSRELPGVDACRRRLEDMHTLIYKPATDKKPKPTLACAECRYKDNIRRERRTICCKCQIGFCSNTCLQNHHHRLVSFYHHLNLQMKNNRDPRLLHNLTQKNCLIHLQYHLQRQGPQYQKYDLIHLHRQDHCP